MFENKNIFYITVYLFTLTAPVNCDILAIPNCTRGEIWTSGVSNYELTYQGQATGLQSTLENIYNCSRDCCMSKCNYEEDCYQISQFTKSSCTSMMSHPAHQLFTFNKCHRTCEAGFESVEGSPCTQCEAGKYKEQAGIHRCTNCPLNTFSETVGSVENDCQSCNRNTHTLDTGASSADQCICMGELVVDCCALCYSRDCIHSSVFFGFENSISANGTNTDQNVVVPPNGGVSYSSCVPTGDVDSNCSRVASYYSFKNTNFSLSKTILSSSHVVLNYGLRSFYEMKTPGLALSLWIMYDDNGPGNGHIFFKSGDFSVSHPPLSTEIHIGGVIVNAEMYKWHNVFVSSDQKRCLDVWFNSQHVCKCCSKIQFVDTNDKIELLGDIESRGVYVDDLRIYSESIYFQEKCDIDIMCGAGKETLDGISCTQCASGKYKNETYGKCQYCMEGTYSSLSGMSSCTNCPVKTYAPSNSTSLSSCVCSVGYSKDNRDLCVACAVGKHKEHVGNSACEIKPFVFVTTVSFELDVGSVFISNEMKVNIRLETSKQMQIDISRIGLLQTDQAQNRRRNLLSVKASFNITSSSQAESLKIEKDVSLDRLQSILSVNFNGTMSITNLYILTVHENVPQKVDGGMNSVVIISIISSIVFVVIVFVLIVCYKKKHSNRKVSQGAIDVSSCEYCTVCDGEILKEYIQAETCPKFVIPVRL